MGGRVGSGQRCCWPLNAGPLCGGELKRRSERADQSGMEETLQPLVLWLFAGSAILCRPWILLQLLKRARPSGRIAEEVERSEGEQVPRWFWVASGTSAVFLLWYGLR